MSKTQDLYTKAKEIIPGGTELLSKRPEMFLPGKWPAYYSKAKGCEIWDLDGNHYYDTCLMGIGANVLGFAFNEVDEAAKEAIDNGGMSTLNPPEEVYVAQKLLELHPWASKARFAKTGGEAMALATRIARAYTKKDLVLVCGYHGWHDWYLAANLTEGDPLAGVHLQGLEPLGVPKGMAGTNLIFHYNNIDEFNALFEEKASNIAAVIMEPIRNDYPVDDFLGKIRETTKKHDVLLVFDEISSGFRLCPGGSHLKLGVTPDIAVFAKAMTNGYPLSAVIGRKEVMESAQYTFISSTFFTERIAYAATIKAIECYQKYKVDEYINSMGESVQKRWKKTAEEIGVKIKVSGIFPLSHFEFLYPDNLAYKTFFTQEMLKRGFLASNGFYMSYAHTEEIIDKYFESFVETLKLIKEINESGKSILDYVDVVCQTGFQRLI